MIKIKEALIVEGRYDKNKLKQIFDTIVVETGGFSIFSDDETLKLIRTLAETRGIVVLTDPDGAGFVIRNYIRGALPKDKVLHAYIPDVYGKEKRKDRVSKEGKLGVEGVSDTMIIEAVRSSGAMFFEGAGKKMPGREVTKADFFDDGIMGRQGSAGRRLSLLKKLGLPERLGTNALLDIINAVYGFDEYKKTASSIDDAREYR